MSFLVGNSASSLPDAWRFDDGGCNDGFIYFTSLPPPADLSKCGNFVPLTLERFETPAYGPADASLGVATTLGQASLTVTYPNDGTGLPSMNPATRYRLAMFLFDHTFSILGPTPPDGSSCGGLEEGICILPIPSRCTWLDLEGNEFRFPIATPVLRANGGTVWCDASVPARRKTWGEIKAQYKR